MFTNEELKNIATLLQRVDLKGSEALPIAQLQIKVGNLIKETETTTTSSENTATENSPTE